jgi:hypothetical protein
MKAGGTPTCSYTQAATDVGRGAALTARATGTRPRQLTSWSSRAPITTRAYCDRNGGATKRRG